MSYIEKMCFVNWRFRSFVQYIWFLLKKSKFSFYFIFLEDLQLINLLTMIQAESQ